MLSADEKESLCGTDERALDVLDVNEARMRR